jgi:DNA modification methylase
MRPPKSLFTVHEADCRDLESLLSPYSSSTHPLLTCTITSPPYGALKDYGHADQIGWGQSLDQYLQECERLFGTIFEHTRNDGSLWLVADTIRMYGGKEPPRLEPLPFRLADRATRAGWTLKDIIVWKKDKARPWSTRGRLRRTFELVLLLTKSDDYKYEVDRIRDPVRLKRWWVQYPERYNPQGKIPTNVWEIPIPTQGSWRNTAIQHACPLPPDLVERAILLSSDPGDVVLDPFAGSGVVVAESERLGRRGIGVELVSRHVDAYSTVVRSEILQRRGRDELAERIEQSSQLQDRILKLRVLKYPRVLLQQLTKKRPDLPLPLMAATLSGNAGPSVLRQAHQVIDSTTVFLHEGSEEERNELQLALKEISLREPASKFGIFAEILVAGEAEMLHLLSQRPRLYYYPNGRTWMAITEVDLADVSYLARFARWSYLPPIIGDVEVRETPQLGDA